MRLNNFDALKNLKNLKGVKNIKIGKSKEKQNGDTAEADDTSVTQIAELEEQLNNRTKYLEATEQQLKELSNTENSSEKSKELSNTESSSEKLEELSNTENSSEEDEGTPPQPHGPLSELSIEPGDDLMDDETDVDALLGEEDEEVKLVEVGAGTADPAEAEKEPPTEDANDSFNNLFSQDEEEENPLAALINSLPDVTAQELLDDLQEIKDIIREWHQN